VLREAPPTCNTPRTITAVAYPCVGLGYKRVFAESQWILPAPMYTPIAVVWVTVGHTHGCSTHITELSGPSSNQTMCHMSHVQAVMQLVHYAVTTTVQQITHTHGRSSAAVQGNRLSGSSTETSPEHKAVKTVTKQQHRVCINISNSIALHSWAQSTDRYRVVRDTTACRRL